MWTMNKMWEQLLHMVDTRWALSNYTHSVHLHSHANTVEPLIRGNSVSQQKCPQIGDVTCVAVRGPTNNSNTQCNFPTFIQHYTPVSLTVGPHRGLFPRSYVSYVITIHFIDFLVVFLTSRLFSSRTHYKTPKHIPASRCLITAREEPSNHAVVLTTHLRHIQHCERSVLTRQKHHRWGRTPALHYPHQHYGATRKERWTQLTRHPQGQNNLSPNLNYRSGPTQGNTRGNH